MYLKAPAVPNATTEIIATRFCEINCFALSIITLYLNKFLFKHHHLYIIAIYSVEEKKFEYHHHSRIFLEMAEKNFIWMIYIFN